MDSLSWLKDMKSLSDSNKISNITKSLINLVFIAFKREQMVDKYEISQNLTLKLVLEEWFIVYSI